MYASVTELYYTVIQSLVAACEASTDTSTSSGSADVSDRPLRTSMSDAATPQV